MQIGTPANTSNAFLARAYGMKPAQRMQGAAPKAVAGSIAPAGPVERANQAATTAKADTAMSRLVAAVVPGKVDFSGATPAQSAPAATTYSMFGRPADRNEAALGVALGRRLDISG